MSVNNVSLLGNIGSDIELRSTPNGNSVISFSLATNEKYTTKQGEKKEHTEWHNIVAWQNLAEVTSNFCKKGSQVFIEGKLETKEYQNKEGVKVYKTQVNAKQIQFLDKKPKEADGNTGFTTEDIPFN